MVVFYPGRCPGLSYIGLSGRLFYPLSAKNTKHNKANAIVPNNRPDRLSILFFFDFDKQILDPMIDAKEQSAIGILNRIIITTPSKGAPGPAPLSPVTIKIRIKSNAQARMAVIKKKIFDFMKILLY
jgi:hypothetical protein